MFRKLLTSALIVFSSVSLTWAQVGQGALKGKIVDKETGEPLPFVNVIVEMNGSLVTGAASDFDGKFSIKPLTPGTYDVKATFTGYQPTQISGVIVKADRITFQNINMGQTAIDIKEFEVIEYTVPLIDKDNTTSGETVTREDIDKLPGRSATAVAQTVGGVYSKDDGSGDLNIRGSRDDANYYYIDGVKVRGSTSLPKAAIEQVSVMTGGLPAQYGDVTGGVISITTRGASSQYFGGIDYLTSGYKLGDKTYGLDAFGYNLLEFSLAGPLLSKKDSTGKKLKPLLGFFVAGNLTSIVDDAPSAIGMWKVKDEKLAELNADPLRFAPVGTGTFLNHEFVRLNDLEKVKFRQNVTRNGFTLNGKVDVNTTQNTNLTFGGSMDFNVRHDDDYRSSSGVTNKYEYTLMNTQNNPEERRQTWRVYSRFTQRFGSANPGEGQKSASTIKNAYYSIQVDYSKFRFKEWDETHKDNFFNYGYIGKFTAYQAPFYIQGLDSITQQGGLIHQTFVDTLIGFEPGTANPEGAQFTQSYYELFGWEGYDANGNPIYNHDLAHSQSQQQNTFVGLFFEPYSNSQLHPVSFNTATAKQLDGAYDNTINIEQNGGMLNGSSPRNVFDMWRSPAFQHNVYDFRNNSQFRINATGSADIKDHAISVGFEYEQRVDKGYIVSPRGLWTLGRSYTNNHIINLDIDNPQIDSIPGGLMFSYDRLNSAKDADWGGDFSGNDPQYFFDYNLRKKLGLNPDGTEWIDFDSYSPETYSIDMFSADELLNNGNSFVNYWGYDHHGNKLKKDPTFDDFFNATDQFGNFTRPISAFRPIYTAFFIQDKFSFDDLVFNIGLRIDRFDANQQVLKDPFVLFPTVKANEDEARKLLPEEADLIHPETIEAIASEAVVYVDNVGSPSTILGYRIGDTWYNSEGSEIAGDTKTIEATVGTATGIAPLLVDKTKTRGRDISSASFEDYKPQTVFMPRIAFSFPISDEALFFAHYDVLAKRPTSGLRLDPVDYYFIESAGSNALNNPNLKPEKTIDYEVGFQQKINNYSSLKLSGFYREFRDMVQIRNLVGAYPNTYITFDNLDFATVKGLVIAYDLRRFGNVRLRASYTLQFAEGTGSNSTSGLGLARAGKPNLRTTIPLSFDQRHGIVINTDYRYGGGKDYNGPVLLGKQIFAGSGFNLVFNAGSGVPYSRQSNVTSTGLFTGGSALLDGNLNGARNPWQFKMDATIDRDIELKFGKEEEKTKLIQMNVYMQVLNVFNAKNVVSVYRFTGNPDDDGYLAAAEFQSQIQAQNDEQSFRELYNLKINSGNMYSLPRRIRLGIRANF